MLIFLTDSPVKKLHGEINIVNHEHKFKQRPSTAITTRDISTVSFFCELYICQDFYLNNRLNF